MGGTKGKNLKTPKSVKCPASISENPVPLCTLTIYGHLGTKPPIVQCKVVYICVSSWLLANKSRDLSQAEKKITVVKPEQIQRMTINFTQNGQKLSF